MMSIKPIYTPAILKEWVSCPCFQQQ